MAMQQVDFTRADLDGRSVSLSDYRGNWVVVNFWATWCGPCIRELPLLQSLHDDHEDVVVIAVNFETISPDLLRGFVDDMDLNFPIVQVGSEPLLPFEPLKGLPSTFIVNPDGFYVAGRAGEVHREWLEKNTGR